MSSPVITLLGLTKHYGAVRALSGLDLEVRPGPVGLLGPNGAGKSTLIKLLLGQLAPTAGQARIVGQDPSTARGRLDVRRNVGYMPEGECLIPGMNGVDLVTTLGRTAGMTKRDAMTRSHEVLDYVGLEEQRYRGLEEYSTGMKQRLKLAQALVHDPPLLLLDEPTNGLDPHGRRHMLDLVADLGFQQGKNVLICSHLLPDIEATCRDVVVIHRGRLLKTGSIEELTRREEGRLVARVAGGAQERARFEAELAAGGIVFENEGLDLKIQLEPEEGDRLFGLARDAGTALTLLKPELSTLEDAFLGALIGEDVA